MQIDIAIGAAVNRIRAIRQHQRSDKPVAGYRRVPQQQDQIAIGEIGLAVNAGRAGGSVLLAASDTVAVNVNCCFFN